MIPLTCYFFSMLQCGHSYIRQWNNRLECSRRYLCFNNKVNSYIRPLSWFLIALFNIILPNDQWIDGPEGSCSFAVSKTYIALFVYIAPVIIDNPDWCCDMDMVIIVHNLFVSWLRLGSLHCWALRTACIFPYYSRLAWPWVPLGMLYWASRHLLLFRLLSSLY